MAGQILDALAAAHQAGIIHRDFKPGNIMVGPHGVKVLDFGLAKIKHGPASAEGSEEATETMPLTVKGSILGTLGYMSPKQIEGQEADARSDIFAFGIVLYELISGKRPFTGKSQAIRFCLLTVVERNRADWFAGDEFCPGKEHTTR